MSVDGDSIEVLLSHMWLWVEDEANKKNRRIQSQRAVRDKETEKLKLYGFTKTFSRETKKEISK